MNNLALVESKSLREEHINQVDVLEKVKAVEYMTDDMIVSVEQAAEYYETPVTTIRSLVNDHRKEFKGDGLRTLSGSKLKKFKGSLDNPSTLKYASQFTVIPRKAMLRIGMLLRDSEVAIKIRDYLLETEQNQNEFTPETALKTFREIKKILDEIGATAEAKLETTRAIFSKAGIEIPVTVDNLQKTIMTQNIKNSNTPNENKDVKLYLNQRLFKEIKKKHRWSTPDLANYVGTSRNHMWSLLKWKHSVGNVLKSKLIKAFPQYQDLLFVEIEE